MVRHTANFFLLPLVCVLCEKVKKLLRSMSILLFNILLHVVNSLIILRVSSVCRPSTDSLSSVGLSVCLSVCDALPVGLRVPCSHRLIWNCSKIISRPSSLRLMRWLTPTWAIWCNRDTPKLRQNRGGARAHKSCHISEMVQDMTEVTITD